MTLSDALFLIAAWATLSLVVGLALGWFITRAKEDRRPTVADIQRMRAAQAAAEAEAEAAIYGDVPALNGTIGDRNG
jgi:uncharacterized membrane-anchored protein YhcB (DUF1043 family)